MVSFLSFGGYPNSNFFFDYILFINQLGKISSLQRLTPFFADAGIRCIAAGWTSGFCQGAIRLSAKALPPSYPKFTMSSQNHGARTFCVASAPQLQLLSHPLAALKKKDTSTCLLLMSPWPHVSVCPWLADGSRGRPNPSEPCRATSALAGRAYSVAEQVASALHSMAVLQVFQAKMLASEEAGLDSASLRDLRSAIDLALRATKATAQAIGRSMSSLIVLEHHLWLMMTEMKEADKVPFLDAPVSSGSLFGLAVEGFAERFTEAQKSSKAMRHFLPKHTSSSSTSSRPKPAPTPQTAKPSPTTPEPRLPEGRQNRGSSHSA